MDAPPASMKPIFLSLTLAVAASTSAVAQPYRPAPSQPVEREYRDYNGDDYFERDRAPYERFDRTRWQRDFSPRWVTLGASYSATTNRQFVNLRGQRFDRLRVEAVRGKPLITQIAVEYSNGGGTQVIKLGSRYAQGSGEVLRLNATPINRIVIYTDARYGGSYGVYAAQGRAPNRVGRR
jgi:hypothetical protein